MYRVIVLNPGSTSTKVAFYEDDRQIFSENLSHPAEELGKFEKIVDQLPYRKKVILDMLEEKEIDLMNVDAFSAICTGLLPMPGGVFEVNEIMYEHGSYGPGSRHPGNLGPMLARDFAEETGARAFVVDPSSLDEMIPEARMTGFVELIRTERGHPLNQKAVGRKYASDTGKKYEELNLVIAHLGGGISVSAHEKGKMIDSVDSTRGEGRMAPTRSGAAPLADVVEMCYSGQFTKDEMLAKIMKQGGWTAHLGTSDAREVEKKIASGDSYNEAAALKGKVDAVLITGGIAYSRKMVGMLEEQIGFIAPVHVYPGEYEMDALAAGAVRVLRGEETPLSYSGKPVFPGFDELRKQNGYV